LDPGDDDAAFHCVTANDDSAFSSLFSGEDDSAFSSLFSGEDDPRRDRGSKKTDRPFNLMKQQQQVARFFLVQHTKMEKKYQKYYL
jgi:hypothetical protein